MATVRYMVSGKLNGKWARERFTDSRQAKEFAKTLEKPKTTYEVRIRINGRQVSKSFDRKVDADDFANTEESKKRRGQAVDPRDSKITIGDYADQWFARRTDLADTTRELYKHYLEKYIKPRLGKKAVGALTTWDVRAWHGAIPQLSTAAKAYRLLRTIMNAAVEDRLRLDNPCKIKGAGTEPESKRPSATPAEVEALANAMPDHLRLLVLLATWTSLRRAELLGLRRKDIDVLYGKVSVHETEVVTLSGIHVRKGPKSKAGSRKLSIPESILQDVIEHLAGHVGPNPDDLVFNTTLKELRTAWDRARRSINRPELHLHDLRGAGLTMLGWVGATTAELMYRAGHSTPAMVMRYQRATMARDEALTQAVASLRDIKEGLEDSA